VSGRLTVKRVLQRMIEDPMSEMILKGEIPNGSMMTFEPNDTPYEEVAEGETIVNIRVTQPKEVVKAE